MVPPAVPVAVFAAAPVSAAPVSAAAPVPGAGAASGDGGADAETAFRVRRVSYSYMLFDASSTQVFGGGSG